MVDTDKALIGLGQHISGRTPERCGACPYFNGDSGYGVSCRDELLDDLYEMLEEQEPRVMTLDEVKRFVYGMPYIIETNKPREKPHLMYGLYSHQGVNGCFYFAFTNALSHFFDADYGKRWRCWNTKPSKEDMEAEPWN